MLPDGTAVLSGGVTASAEAQALREGALPALYAGAPMWVVDAVLDPRAQRRELTFCYWWDGSQWLMGDSPTDHAYLAAPAVWGDESIARTLSGFPGNPDQAQLMPAVTQLVAAVLARTATREQMAAVLPGDHDVDAAMQQLQAVGVTVYV